MKRAYKDEWVRHHALRETAREWSNEGLLTQGQLQQIDAAFPQNYYRPGIFVRIGLFIFAWIACAFTFGFFMLFVINNDTTKGIAVICLIAAVAFAVALHGLINARSLLYAGVDSAILYAMLLCLATAPFLAFDHIPIEMASLSVTVLCSVATYFYADRLTLLVAFTAVLTLLFNLLAKIPFGTAILPFVVAACCIGLLQIIKQIHDLYYESCVVFARAVLLLVLYASCNYLVVREGNAMLTHVRGEAPEIPGAVIFWLITFLVPLMYLAIGIRKKSRTLIRVGLLTLLASFYTFYHAHPFLPGPEASLLAGLAMMVLSALVIRKLRTPWYGLSDVSDRQNKLVMIELVLAAQQTHMHQSNPEVKLGGGDFGGGGAGNAY